MGLLDRRTILLAEDITHEDVSCPEWGGDVRIRALTGSERDRFEAILTGLGNKGRKANFTNFRARLVAMSAVDDTGALLFTSADLVSLGDKNAAVLDRLCEVARRLSGLSDQDVEELVEDFDEPPSGPSTTG